ncbi:MAG TPA: DUF6364 family protein [Candidatus Acidoferrum sp.]|jgi:hypothetical protein
MKRKLTICLDEKTIRKAEILAAREGISLSDLLARKIELMVGDAKDYAATKRLALAYLDQGFHMGGGAGATREKLHERRG